jgi:hypothetical protein
MMQSYLTAYRKKFGRDPLYCSTACSNEGRRKDTETRNNFVCINCGKPSFRTRNASGRVYVTQKLCSKQCKNEWVSKLYRARHGLPIISKRIKRKYIELRIPASNGNPIRFVAEHRYVMEQSLGRQLYPEETVHHKDGNGHNNQISNLELWSSHHGPGQRVEDKITFAIEILGLYPDFAERAGVKLIHV